MPIPSDSELAILAACMLLLLQWAHAGEQIRQDVRHLCHFAIHGNPDLRLGGL